MIRFATLLDRLSTSPGRSAKLALIARWLDTTPDPDRGYGMAALVGDLTFPTARPALLRGLIETRTDPVLFALSYDFVGDLAETCALMWPDPPPAGMPALAASLTPPTLGTVVETLATATRLDVPGLLIRWLDALDTTGRWALLKLITGGLRVGVSARLARTAFAQWAGQPLASVEEVWFSQRPPYTALIAWAIGCGERPGLEDTAALRPFMLATPLEDGDRIVPDDSFADTYAVEWKWDGIRAQLVGAKGGRERRIYSRGGEDISAAFPDLLAAITFDGAVDGEILVLAGDGSPAPFAWLQKRLNRKTAPGGLLDSHPAVARLYDLLLDGPEDLRPLPFRERRRRLEAWMVRQPRPSFDLSPLVAAAGWPAVEALRVGARAAGREGLMLKRWDSPYVGGRPRGMWLKAKRDPLNADAVLLYAQHGHGKRSGLYSDFTFGVWSGDRLVPVGKAYSGFSDAELARLDAWVRAHTLDRYGPVRSVKAELVLEIAFDGVQRSSRHKSGLALRFPRIKRIRWDKPATEADRLDTLETLVDI